jgi:predicted anti-sigma-YlaC factor YlaD
VTDHTTTQLADYLQGRLDPTQELEVKRHVEACADCAADLAFARELRQNAMSQGMMHLSTTRIIAIATEGSSADEVEERHLDRCEACRSEYAWAEKRPGEDAWDSLQFQKRRAQSVEVEPTERPAQPVELEPRRRRRGPSTTVWTLGVAAAAVLAVVLLLPRGQDVQEAVRALASPQALPVSTTRAQGDPGSFEDTRAKGLNRYAEGDYSGAQEHLRSALALQPGDGVATLYLASAEVLTAQVDPAASRLQDLLSGDLLAGIRSEALWLLIQVRVIQGRGGEALSLLARDEVLPERYRDAAGPLRDRLEALQ